MQTIRDGVGRVWKGGEGGGGGGESQGVHLDFFSLHTQLLSSAEVGIRVSASVRLFGLHGCP